MTAVLHSQTENNFFIFELCYNFTLNKIMFNLCR